MSKKRKRPMHDSDYDGAWKHALMAYFAWFLRVYFPAVHAAIDWSYEVEWLDRELGQVLGQSGRRSKAVDLLTRVRLLSGEMVAILLHLEIQTTQEEDFSVRVSLYNCGLRWAFRERVITLVVLADLNRDWLPEEDVFELAGFESRLRFPTCKLIERLETDWRDEDSLPVIVARAQIEALRTASDAEGRFAAKKRLVRGLYESGYNADEVRETFTIIDWMMHLRDDLEERFKIELEELEEELSMPYVTSVERIAKAEGKAEGAATVILTVLRRECGRLPKKLQDRIHGLSLEDLEKLQRRMFDFEKPGDVADWLDAKGL